VGDDDSGPNEKNDFDLECESPHRFNMWPLSMTAERSSNRSNEMRTAIVKSSKARSCPICGEKLSLFDRTHIKEKHTEYFRETRKWRLAYVFSLISEGVFIIIDGLSQDWSVRWLAVTGALIALACVLLTFFKWLIVAKRYKVPWWKLTVF
jgi:hypothetical protein